MNDCTVFNNVELTTTIVAILVHKLGGKVTIEQEDFDAIAGFRLAEHGTGRAISFEITVPTERTQ